MPSPTAPLVPLSGTGTPPAYPPAMLRSTSRYLALLDTHARLVLLEAIAAAHGQPDTAASSLGLSRGSLYRELRRLGMVDALARARLDAGVAPTVTA